MTPRSVASVPATQNNWLSGLGMPGGSEDWDPI